MALNSSSRLCGRLLGTGRVIIHGSTRLSTTNASLGKHSSLWTAERALSLSLLGITPAAFIFSNQQLDALMALSVVMHQHWGLEAIVTDYVRPVIFGNVLPKVAHGTLLAFSAVSLGGLLYFNYNDGGITKSIKKMWSIGGNI